LGLLIPSVANDFKREGTHSEVLTYNLNDHTAILRLSEKGLDDYHVTLLKLRGHEGSEFKLVQEFESRGRTRQDAIENAQMISYEVALKDDSVLRFDSNITFKSDAQFRGQKLNMTLYIPYDHPFIMYNDLRHLIYNTIGRYNYKLRDMGSDNTWIFTQSGLECVTCPGRINRSGSRDDDESRSLNNRRLFTQDYDFADFNRIEITGPYQININQADEFEVSIQGPRSEVRELRVRKIGSRLDVDNNFDISSFGRRKDITISILMPELEYLELKGPSRSTIRGFNQEYLKIKLTAGSEADVTTDALELSVELTGAAKLYISGKGNELIADITAASYLDAYDFEVKEARIEATAASDAKLYVTEILDMDTNLGSDIEYKGNPRVIRNN